jgi:hypothetical protein
MSAQPSNWDNMRRFLEKLCSERRRERDAARAAVCSEWYIAVDAEPTSPDARIAVAELMGEMRIAWHEGRRW